MRTRLLKHDFFEFKVQCLKVFCYHGNKSTILLFNSIFRKTPEVSSKLYFVEICQVSEKLWPFIYKELIFGFQILDLKDHFSASINKVITILNLDTQKKQLQILTTSPPPPPLQKNIKSLKPGYTEQFFTCYGNAVSTNYCIAVACANFCVECLVLAMQHFLKSCRNIENSYNNIGNLSVSKFCHRTTHWCSRIANYHRDGNTIISANYIAIVGEKVLMWPLVYET